MPPVVVVKVNGTILAESSLYDKVEDNVYFPPASVNYQYLKPSTTKSYCPWKGECSYYNIEVGEMVILDGAWYFPDPKDKFLDCKGFLAFCTYAPLMLVMRRVPLRFHKNKPDLSIGTIIE